MFTITVKKLRENACLHWAASHSDENKRYLVKYEDKWLRQGKPHLVIRTAPEGRRQPAKG